ncbi:hypothetical protein EPUS_07163 [Endocarpon pusillum Z07020]|uniref:Uncharacterized protein n=1 Tax=Endocarpon pusillum (strain Z07020 / HMAS-L-300199) TaxID=1263415 RepID=U1FUW4_ENDPU|nr:uncharacterized protein EPUS_07163 [Endocarpon pusillum Z07020]ERF68602.1 hypothetical protein EPUS_07163 [Endocarpon pusillum Z07020]
MTTMMAVGLETDDWDVGNGTDDEDDEDPVINGTDVGVTMWLDEARVEISF